MMICWVILLKIPNQQMYFQVSDQKEMSKKIYQNRKNKIKIDKKIKIQV